MSLFFFQSKDVEYLCFNQHDLIACIPYNRQNAVGLSIEDGIDWNQPHPPLPMPDSSFLYCPSKKLYQYVISVITCWYYVLYAQAFCCKYERWQSEA